MPNNLYYVKHEGYISVCECLDEATRLSKIYWSTSPAWNDKNFIMYNPHWKKLSWNEYVVLRLVGNMDNHNFKQGQFFKCINNDIYMVNRDCNYFKNCMPYIVECVDSSGTSREFFVTSFQRKATSEEIAQFIAEKLK